MWEYINIFSLIPSFWQKNHHPTHNHSHNKKMLILFSDKMIQEKTSKWETAYLNDIRMNLRGIHVSTDNNENYDNKIMTLKFSSETSLKKATP